MLDETIREVETLRPPPGQADEAALEGGRRVVVIALLLAGIALSVTGEMLLKAGMNRFGVLELHPSTLLPTLFRVFTQPLILLGFVFVFGASIFWLAVLSRVHLSFAYPMLALGYVVTAFLASLFFDEAISLTRWAGIVIVCLGVVLISRT